MFIVAPVSGVMKFSAVEIRLGTKIFEVPVGGGTTAVSLTVHLASTVQMKEGEIERMLTIIDKNNRRISETSILMSITSALLVGHIRKPAARLGLLAGAMSVLGVFVLTPMNGSAQPATRSFATSSYK